jgi:hypothetical protein
MIGFYRVVVISCALAITGCRAERYFGPYELQVPTELEEVAAGRTFEFPLDEEDNHEMADLQTCLVDEPDRPVPCICDYPILTVSEQVVRMDYRLTHQGGRPVNVMVWVGRETLPREQDPDMIPDLPRVAVLAEHHHQMDIGSSIDSSFLENEMRDVDRAWTASVYPGCPGFESGLPAPLELIFGLALDSADSTSQVSLAFSLRVKQNN